MRVQLPLALGLDRQPEPDACIVEGSFHDYRHAHPTTAALVTEVADTAVALDRFKAGVYAQAGIPGYWILNLKDSCLEVHGDPRRDEDAPSATAIARSPATAPTNT